MTEIAAGDGELPSDPVAGGESPVPRALNGKRKWRPPPLVDPYRPEIVDAVRRARTALPGDPKFGDPLSTAGPGTPRAVARVTERIAGDRPNAVRELGLGALQVWQAIRERLGGKDSREVTIVFTDLVAFSRWSLSAGDATTLDLLRQVAIAIEPPVVAHGGDVVKRMGDGMMAVFYTPDRAVQAAAAALDNLAAVEVDGYRPQMRVGIHTGSPRAVGEDWFGVDVTVAARLMEAGGNGRTVISGTTLAALHPDTLGELGYRPRQQRRNPFAPITGIPDDLRIYTLQRKP